jgi:hypothetical protein
MDRIEKAGVVNEACFFIVFPDTCLLFHHPNQACPEFVSGFSMTLNTEKYECKKVCTHLPNMNGTSQIIYKDP